MDQEQASVALTSSTSLIGKKLNAEAPEFVPGSFSSSSSAGTPPHPPPTLQPAYAPAPTLVRPVPPSYYGYKNYYQQNLAPFYPYNANQVIPVEFAADANGGSPAALAASKKNGLTDSHQKIINQVEFYFSGINLATTDQLFRYMSKDPEGYVPLSVVASFKKIKTAITDSMQLASILRNSKKLLVSEDGKKVKLLHPLTESDMEELQSRIVIAENLPEDHSHQNLMKIFSSVGSVKSIRTCPPQNSHGGASSPSRTGKGDGLHFSSKFHAFVEYESVEDAEKAVTELKDDGSWRNGLKVRLLLKSAVKSTQARAKKVGHEGQPIGRKDEADVPEMLGCKETNFEDSVHQSDAQSHERQLEDNEKGNARRKGRNSIGSSGNGSNKGKGKGEARGRSQHPTNGASILGYPSLEVPTNTEKLTVGKASPVPRMPDGTKGFSMGRGKPVAVKIA